jgi:hypothetical protein
MTGAGSKTGARPLPNDIKESSMKQRVIQARLGSIGYRVVIGLACAALAVGCETITEKVTQKVTEAAIERTIEKESGGKVEIDSSKGSVSFKSDKGSLEINGGGTKLPDNWPQDVPLYPGSKVTMSMSNPTQQMLSLETADSPEKAIEFYKGKLSAMKQEAAMNTEQQSMLYYKDANGRQVQLAIGKESGGSGPNTTIALIVHSPEKRPAQ